MTPFRAAKAGEYVEAQFGYARHGDAWFAFGQRFKDGVIVEQVVSEFFPTKEEAIEVSVRAAHVWCEKTGSTPVTAEGVARA